MYGTLAPGRSNHHEISEVAGTWEPGIVTGHLFPEGWGAALGYPGIVLDESAPEVAGFLLTSDLLSEHWERLDEFEGEGYSRVEVVVRLEDGRSETAHIYALRGLTPETLPR